MHPSVTPLPALWPTFRFGKISLFFFLAERGSGIVDVDGNQSRWSLERRGDPQRSAPKAKAIVGRRDASRRGPTYPPPPPNPPCGAERNHFREKEKGCPPFVSGLFSPGSPAKVAGAARLERSRRPCSRCSSVRSRGSREPTTLPSIPAAAATGRRLSRPREEEVGCWVGTTGLGCTQA